MSGKLSQKEVDILFKVYRALNEASKLLDTIPMHGDYNQEHLYQQEDIHKLKERFYDRYWLRRFI